MHFSANFASSLRDLRGNIYWVERRLFKLEIMFYPAGVLESVAKKTYKSVFLYQIAKRLDCLIDLI